jgi:hypothetical protein
MNEAAEIKLRAERKAGEALAAMNKPKGGRRAETGDGDAPVSKSRTLEQMGIKKHQSADWQVEASVPEPEFEAHVAEARATGEPLTTAGVVRLALTSRRPPAASAATRAPSGRGFGCSWGRYGSTTTSSPGANASHQAVPRGGTATVGNRTTTASGWTLRSWVAARW